MGSQLALHRNNQSKCLLTNLRQRSQKKPVYQLQKISQRRRQCCQIQKRSRMLRRRFSDCQWQTTQVRILLVRLWSSWTGQAGRPSSKIQVSLLSSSTRLGAATAG